eukprot:7941790-Prorocentrum_lima.AAC.1
MKHQLRELKELPSTTNQSTNHPDAFHVRREELFVPLEGQEEVKNNFGQGVINPAAGLKKHTSDNQR